MSLRAVASTSERGYLPPQNEAERLVARRAQDLYAACQKNWAMRCSGFLSDREQNLCQAALNAVDCSCHLFAGGYPGAERRMLCVAPTEQEMEEPPLCGLAIRCRLFDGQAPAHRDYLGALMALGLERSCLGDVVLDAAVPGCAYVVVLQRVAALVQQELREVGHFAVTVEPLSVQELAAVQPPSPQEQSATVSSLRLDAVLAAVLRCGRAQAADLIKAGRVAINHVPVGSIHAALYANDVLTVRGFGRFCLTDVGGKSRKDRTFIRYTVSQ